MKTEEEINHLIQDYKDIIQKSPSDEITRIARDHLVDLMWILGD